MIGFAVIGYGYWGPNLVRNIMDVPNAQLRYVCDLRADRLTGVQSRYPSVVATSSLDEVLADPKVHAVAIATPVATHYPLAMRALKAGKHVFVEKPVTDSVEDAARLVEEAQKRGLILAVDHTFIHTSAVRMMKQLAESSLGDLYYYDSVRVNLGIFQQDVDVIWDLAVHDLAIMDFVLAQKPVAVAATGMSHVPDGPADIAYLTLHFPGNLIGHIHVNWLAPVKVRRTLLGGSKKMIVYDDIEPSEKIKVYDKGITLSGEKARRGESKRRLLVGYRSGDMTAPQLDISEALARELKEFVFCIENSATPTADGLAGLRIVHLLEAASRSLAQRGRVIELQPERELA
jgi:predicted dehydrogenase